MGRAGEKKSKKQTQTESKTENFNLKKFLVENKLTNTSRIVEQESNELEQILNTLIQIENRLVEMGLLEDGEQESDAIGELKERIVNRMHM